MHYIFINHSLFLINQSASDEIDKNIIGFIFLIKLSRYTIRTIKKNHTFLINPITDNVWRF